MEALDECLAAVVVEVVVVFLLHLAVFDASCGFEAFIVSGFVCSGKSGSCYGGLSGAGGEDLQAGGVLRGFGLVSLSLVVPSNSSGCCGVEGLRLVASFYIVGVCLDVVVALLLQSVGLGGEVYVGGEVLGALLGVLLEYGAGT